MPDDTPRNKPRALYQVLAVLTKRLLAAKTETEQVQIRHTMTAFATSMSGLDDQQRIRATHRCFVFECLSRPEVLALDILGGIEEVRNA